MGKKEEAEKERQRVYFCQALFCTNSPIALLLSAFLRYFGALAGQRTLVPEADNLREKTVRYYQRFYKTYNLGAKLAIFLHKFFFCLLFPSATALSFCDLLFHAA